MINNRQFQILKAINKYVNENEISPTVRELCILVKLKSTSTVASHLKHLLELGYIEKIQASPRTIKLTEKGKTIISFR